MKHIPIGIESFKELIDGEYYYVDKTLFIKDVCKEKVALYTRPLHVKEALANLDSSLHVQKQNFSEGSSFDQREFSLRHLTLSGSYTNPYSIASVISVVSGSLQVDTFTVLRGGSILVMPEECIQLTGSAECIIAAAHPYWRAQDQE